MSFKKILGQDKAVNILKGFAASGRIPQAMIFSGPQGCGKAGAALEFAKTLNCLDGACQKEQDNCSLCINCRHIENGTHPDIVFADFAYQAALEKSDPEEQQAVLEKTQSIKIITTRALTAASQQKASFAKWKVYIIDRAETMERGAANSILKFIEEPPPNTVWILISCNKEKMYSTIRSRCQDIAFAPLPEDILLKILKDNFVEDLIAKKAVKYAQGSSTKALKAAEILSDISSLPDGAAFPTAFALNLPKTLALSRVQVSFALEMLSCRAYGKWTAESSSRKEDLQNLLAKLVFYKKAIVRNVSPAMVAEAALMSAAAEGISLKD